MEEINEVRRDVNVAKEKCYTLTGLTYKMTNDNKMTEDKVKAISAITDGIIEKLEKILQSMSKIESKLLTTSKTMESMKKEVAVNKRRKAEAFLERDTISAEKEALQNKYRKLETDLNTSREIMSALEFNEDLEDGSTSTPSGSTSTPKDGATSTPNDATDAE